MRLLLLVILTVSALLLGGCTSNSSNSSAPPSSSSPNNAGTSSTSSTSTSPLSPPQSPEEAKALAALGKAPSISSLSVQGGASGTSGTSSGTSSGTIPSRYQGIQYIGYLASFHRPIWLDLSEEVWTGFNSLSDKLVGGYQTALGNNKLTSFIAASFARPNYPEPLRVSIQQPLAAPWLPDFSTDTSVMFSALGFTAWSADVNQQGSTTLVISVSPFYTADSKEVLLKEPQDYTEVYTHQYPLLIDFVKMCYTEKTQMSFDVSLHNECETITSATDVISYNQTLKTANNAFNDLYQKRSVKIWHPVCADGFGALGDIATNGRMDKPYSEMDFSQGPFSSSYTASSKMAMYCLPNKYLLPGKLGKLIYQDSTGGKDALTIYSIAAVNSNGLEAQGVFYATKASAPPPPQLWVLNRSKVVMVTD